jgi:hypothetical protein
VCVCVGVCGDVFVCVCVCVVCVCVCGCVCVGGLGVCVCVCVGFFNLFIILHAPLLWSNTTCNGCFLHYFHSHYIISTKITDAVIFFIKDSGK